MTPYTPPPRARPHKRRRRRDEARRPSWPAPPPPRTGTPGASLSIATVAHPDPWRTCRLIVSVVTASNIDSALFLYRVDPGVPAACAAARFQRVCSVYDLEAVPRDEPDEGGWFRMTRVDLDVPTSALALTCSQLIVAQVGELLAASRDAAAAAWATPSFQLV